MSLNFSRNPLQSLPIKFLHSESIDIMRIIKSIIFLNVVDYYLILHIIKFSRVTVKSVKLSNLAPKKREEDFGPLILKCSIACMCVCSITVKIFMPWLHHLSLYSSIHDVLNCNSLFISVNQLQ